MTTRPLKGPRRRRQAWFQCLETRQGPGEGIMARTVACDPVMDPVDLHATDWQRASHRMYSASSDSAERAPSSCPALPRGVCSGAGNYGIAGPGDPLRMRDCRWLTLRDAGGPGGCWLYQ